MFWFVSLHSCTGIENEFDCIFSAIIRYILSIGEIDVEAILLLKNPLFLLHLKIPSSLQVPSEQLHSEYELPVLLDSFSLTW